MEKMVEGREGDWECGGCKNRNYAFRSFCNRCKQPRLLVDTKTPPNSKWLPRIGDWICTGCTNNNYASREKCQKCGQPKEVAAIPAIAIPGATFPAYSHYFSSAPDGDDQKVNFGLLGNGVLPEPLSGIQVPAFAYFNSTSQPFSIPKGWRNGDWVCRCGFHNYSSRSQCKSCNASMPPAIGTKRLAPEELAHDLDNKRLNSGNTNYEQQTKPGFSQMVGITTEAGHGGYPPFSGIGSGLVPNWQAPIQFPLQLAAPALLGKGAKQWRAGDWMCTKCNNHNYASREECNRCKTQKDIIAQPVRQAIDTT